MAEREHLVKLVRDRIVDVAGTDDEVIYKPIGDRMQGIIELRKKLVEEAVEYLLDPSTGELADVLEAVETLAALDPACSGMEAVRKAQVAKRAERGGFADLVGLYVMARSD
jgi:predicted house-cleaning noncanonical NTP pyrophosphatase (MazG superfamily)